MKSLWITRRRIPALLLTLLLLITLLPIPAKAADPLTLQSAAVTTGGGVGLTFDRAVSAVDFVNTIKTGFTITGLDRTLPITNATLHGGSNNFVQLYFNAPVRGGEAVALSYTPGSVQAADGGLLAPIPSMDIENNLPHPTLGIDAPPPATVGASYTHTFTATGGTSPYRFTLDSVGGSLPGGLTLSENGAVSGVPTAAGTFPFAIFATDSENAFDLKSFSITVQEPPVNVCEIAGFGYLTLDAALAAIPGGGSATITLLRNIDHNAGVFIEGKAVTFDLNGHTLNINNPASGGFGLAVQSGGSVDLSGSGALNATGETYGVRVSTNSLTTRATVTNATATGPTGEAAYAAGPASVTILGDADASGINAFGAHAISNGVIHIEGNVHATNQGVYASSSVITVDGNVTANGADLLGDAIGIGVGVYGGTGNVKVGGNVTANRVGAMARANGSITIDGMLAAPAYIQFADDEPVSIDDNVTPTTKTGYRTYQSAAVGTVWVRERFSVAVNGSYAQTTGAGSYAEGETVSIYAGTRSDYTFTGWTSSDVTVTSAGSANASFTMPGKAVAVTANWRYNGGGGSGGGGGSSYKYYAITAAAGTGGSISPNGNVSVQEDLDKTFTITPSTGYVISDVLVNGKSVGAVGSYTFTKVRSNQAINVTFQMADHTSPQSGAGFEDVADDAYYAKAIAWAVDKGITKGASGTTFSPNAACTRAQTVTFLWRAMGSPEPVGTVNPFTDISSDAYYYKAVLWAVEKGITNGAGAATFSPNDVVTRGQAVMFQYRAAGKPAAGTRNPFSDVKSDDYCYDAVLWAAKESVTAGTSAAAFSPASDCTRAQIVTFLFRYMGK